MSLPNVSFTNNLGTIQFVRCLLGVTENWEFDGRVARHVKSISVEGHVQQGGIGEQFTSIITDRKTDGKRVGDIGTLTLPWTTLNNIRLTELSFPENVFIDMVPVQAAFNDEWPDLNSYTISFFGVTLYNPRINIPTPNRQLRDEYPNQPLQYVSSFPIGTPRVGVFRTRAGQKNMDVTVSGSFRVTDSKLPPNLLGTLTQRANFGPTTFSVTNPTGWPRTFNLGDAIPEVKKDLNLAHCMVTNAQVSWRVEEQMASLTVQMLCPPQLLK